MRSIDGAPVPGAGGEGAGQSLLAVDRVSARYGLIEALHAVSIEVREGEAVALVGANGAGKSTLMRCIMGMLPCADGGVYFAGRRISGRSVLTRPRSGIAYAPEGRRVFPGLSVQENLLVASRDRDGGRQRAEEIHAMFPDLRKKAKDMGWTLSGGQQQMLAIGRALMLRPRLLLLDEPSLGLSPLLMTAVLDRVRDITRAGTAVLLAEQNVHKALAVSDRAYVIKLGRITHAAPSAALLGSDELAGAFLGN